MTGSSRPSNSVPIGVFDSGIGGLMNALKKVDEALYEKILPEYKKMATESNIFK